MLKRLHEAGLFHQSVYGRNILVQPGPLDFPPEKRSADTPSFRLIDFGRNFCARWVDGTERPPGHATKLVGDEGKEEEGSSWTTV